MTLKRIMVLFLVAICITVLISFKATCDRPGRGARTTSGYDPESNPPRVTDYTIQQLRQPLQDGSNVKFTVQYDTKRYLQLSSTLAIYIGGDIKTTFYDDGTHGDDVAGDFKYTAYICVDIPRFEGALKANIDLLNQKPYLPDFVDNKGKEYMNSVDFDFQHLDSMCETHIDSRIFCIVAQIMPLRLNHRS